MRRLILIAGVLSALSVSAAFAQPTPTPPSMPVPYSENFNGPLAGGAPSNYPNIWSKQFISGTINWVQYSGCLYETPPAHSGYNSSRQLRNLNLGPSA